MTNKISSNYSLEECEKDVHYMMIVRGVSENMKLYKFRPLGSCLDFERIEDIIENGFYCNNFLDFNDMNEGLYKHFSSKAPIPLSDKIKFKICSFSGENALYSELMWGHYANAGKGIVIEVKLKEDCVSDIVPVEYNDSKDTYENLPDDDKDKLKAILSNKSKNWCYEDEYRYLSDNQLVDNKVNVGEITKIYFGTPYTHVSNYDDIKIESKSLKKYISLAEELKIYCKSKEIKCEDFDFDLLNKKNDKEYKVLAMERQTKNGVTMSSESCWTKEP